MTIVLNGVTFSNPVGSMIHGLPQVQDYQVQSAKHHFWGVIGGNINYSVPSFRGIVIPVTIHNFNNEAALRTHVFDIRSQHGLNGTLQVTNQQNTLVSWPLTAFIGFDEDGPPFYDGSGKYLWVQSGKLKFEQIAS
ncbi:MAG: hypothetical protein ABJZ55_26155 [Fuerstiella sp.]